VLCALACSALAGVTAAAACNKDPLQRSQRRAEPGAVAPGSQREPATSPRLDDAFVRVVTQTDGAYAVARAEILRDPGARRYLERRRDHAADWRERLAAETLLGWLDHEAEHDEAQAWVKDQSRRPNRTVLGRYTAVDLGKRVAKLGPVVTPHVLEMLLKTHEYDDDYEAGILYSALERLRDGRAFEPISELLSDRKQPDAMRSAAIGVLQALADARSIPALRAILLDHSESDELRKVAAGALIALEVPDARELFERLLFDAAISIELRRAMAMDLDELHDPRSVPALERALPNADDQTLLATLCSTLGAVGDESDLPSLRGALARATESAAREDCGDAIRRIEERPR